MFRKAMFDRGIRFVVFCRDEEDVKRIAIIYKAEFICWMKGHG